MIDDSLRLVIDAQRERLARVRASQPPEVGRLLARALHPDDVRRALLKERPILRRRAGLLDDPDPLDALETVGSDPAALRAEAAAAGVLDASIADLAYRRLFPSLDLGVYAANHAVGKPSVAWPAALEEHLGQLPVHGGLAFVDGGWLDVIDRFRHRVAELVGGDLDEGDVLRFESFSDGLSTLLASLPGGRLVSTAGHFTTARYIHRFWTDRSGGELVEIPTEPDGSVDLERTLEALTPDTAVVSLSHALWRSGFVQDVYAIAEAVMDVCPDAIFLLDAYQTLGTAPISAGRLPPFSAILGGGVKQLHAGTGAGFAWMSAPLLERVRPARIGWWAHEEPMAFAESFVPAAGAARLRTGTPDPTPMAALLAELDVLASSGGGSLRAAVERARRVTIAQVRATIEAAGSLGLEVVGDWPDRSRAAFLGLRVHDGDALVAALAEEGVFVDHRADAPGAPTGTLRLSASAASFAYELLYVVERVAALSR